MYKRILESAGEIDLIALIFLVIFFVFFSIMLYRVFTARDGFIEKMSKLPLEEDSDR